MFELKDPFIPQHPNPVLAHQGMVITGNAAASSAGLRILREGGNAVDAAIATAATLTVTEPTTNGLGGDAMVLVWMNGQCYGLNASGAAPMALSIDAVRAKHGDVNAMPLLGWTPVTVPGQIAGWEALHQRFGRLPFAQCLQPAIEYAENGFVVGVTLARFWANAAKRFAAADDHGGQFEAWFSTFTQNGHTPKAGDRVCFPDHAKTLRQIAQHGSAAFYRGELAQTLIEASCAQGGFLCREDLASYQPQWVKPMTLDYRSSKVFELPPNTQGAITLIALNILRQFSNLKPHHTETLHRMFEATKQAYVEGFAAITDPLHMTTDLERVLSETYGKIQAQRIEKKARSMTDLNPVSSDTVYLCTADGDGNLVSLIQSNYAGFGSGIVVPGTGIALNNRGAKFSLDSTHINALLPGKQPFHTIMPGMMIHADGSVTAFGVMGGHMQPQGHLQMVTNLIDFGYNPQTALSLPRWQCLEDGKFVLEPGFDSRIINALRLRGHDITSATDKAGFGRGQIIHRLPNGTLVGGCDPRTDSLISCY
jgi:gamma-glutamyltranspeptidase / glutathione hydrolase